MVGVSVAAVLVVDDEDVGRLFVQDGGQAARGLVEVGGGEAARSGRALLTLHAGILVAEEELAVGAEHGRGRGQFDGTPITQGLARCEETVAHLAEFAAGRSDQDDPVSLFGQ